jgi:hypothetical protein
VYTESVTLVEAESAPAGTTTETVCPFNTVDTVPPAAAVMAPEDDALGVGVMTGSSALEPPPPQPANAMADKK